MKLNLNINESNSLTIKVTHKLTAAALQSGEVEVFSTPSMIAFMEKASLDLVQKDLPKGYSTVGTVVNVTHLKATPVGMNVTFNATLTEIDGRRLVFKVSATDEKGLIGEGVHERFVIDSEKFLQRVQAQ